MATAFTRKQISGGGVGEYGAKTRDHRWRNVTGNDLILREIRIDFDALATATGTALALSDTYQIMDVMAGDIVVFMGFDIESAATNAADIDIGLTAGDTDGFVDGIEANDTSPTVVAAPFGLLSGTRFAAADTIDALEKSGAQTLAGCKARFWAFIIRDAEASL
jgi:hypothetical protein